jgi:cytidine deaminase
MVRVPKNFIERARKKATQSISKFRISALGFNFEGNCVATAINAPRFNKFGGGVHAERQLMAISKKKGIVKILICRINDTGKILPIHPCSVCKEIAEKLNIKIITIQEN